MCSICPGSSKDRTSVYGTEDFGSIPDRGTNKDIADMHLFRKILTTLVLTVSCVCSNAQDSRTIRTTVEFEVNTNKIIQNELYNYFSTTVVPTILEKPDSIETVFLIGSASPEGNKARNKYLAEIRAEKIYSYFSGVVPRHKVQVVNDYALFLAKTGLTEEDYRKLRATYVEIHLEEQQPRIVRQVDTVYVRDTLYCQVLRVDTVYVRERPRLVPILGIKSNLVSDAVAAPNIQAELYTHLWGLSLEFDYTFPWWHIDYNQYFYYQVLNGTAGIRKYLKKDYTGHYFGIYVNTAIYDLCFFNKDKGWQGELGGAGLSYGYVFRNRKHQRLKFEPYVRVGWFNTNFDNYYASQPWDGKYYYDWKLRASDFVPRRFTLNYFGPTEIGFNLTFDLVCLRKY